MNIYMGACGIIAGLGMLALNIVDLIITTKQRKRAKEYKNQCTEYEKKIIEDYEDYVKDKKK